MRVCGGLQRCGLVVRLERLENLARIIDEIQDVRGVLARVGTIQARERLYRLNTTEHLVDVHAAKQRLVKAGLEFVGDQEQVIVRLGEGIANIASLQAGVQAFAGLGNRNRKALWVVDFTRERHQHAQRVVALFNVGANRFLPAYSLFATRDYDHRLRFALKQRLHVLAVVLDDDLHLLRDVVGVQPNPLHDALHGGAALDLLLVQFLAVVGQLERQLVGRVILQHIEDEAFLDGLAHRIHMERLGQAIRACAAKQFQRLLLRGCSKGHVGQAIHPGARFHLRGQQHFRVNLATVLQVCPLLRREQLLELGG